MIARKRKAIASALLIASTGLAGCAETEFLVHTAKQVQKFDTPASVGRYKVGSPYEINGVWYYPRVDYSYVETGIASWYGPNFHAKTTANGEVFDENAVSAAHRTLPMPSVVRVTNLENGRSIVVRVNDRGPFAHGRIIDMSRRAAQLLGFEVQGTAKVRVEILAEESRQIAEAARNGGTTQLASLPQSGSVMPPPAAAPSMPVAVAKLDALPATAVSAPPPASSAVASQPLGAVDMTRQSRSLEVQQAAPEQTEIFVQAGAFTNMGNAETLGRVLASVGPISVTPKQIDGKQFYRVRIGPLNTVDDADRVLAQVIAQGYPGARVIVE